MNAPSSVFNLIVATDTHNGIGLNNTLPWHLPEDLKYFKQLTTHQTVIMGRNTWDSLPPAFRPLPNRTNIVLTRTSTIQTTETLKQASSLTSALDIAWSTPSQHVFVIGGSQVYQEAIVHPRLEKIYRTLIHQTYACDTFFPSIPNQFKLLKTEEHQKGETHFEFQIYQNQNISSH